MFPLLQGEFHGNIIHAFAIAWNFVKPEPFVKMNGADLFMAGLQAKAAIALCAGKLHQPHDHLKPDALAVIFLQKPESFEFSRVCVYFFHCTRTDHFFFVEHHQKQATGQWLLTTIDGLESALELPALAVSLTLREVYQGIAFAEPDKSVTES